MITDGQIAELTGVLIVDDDYAKARSLASHLQAAGFAVSIAHSAEHAEKLIQDCKKPFDVALLDIILPIAHHSDGIQFEGFNLAERLKKTSPKTALVAMSAYMAPDQMKALSGAFDLCLKKSDLNPQQISKVISGLVTNRRTIHLPVIFIVHGQDESAKWSLKNYLQNSLHLGEPVILHEKPSQGRTIIEKFEVYASQADVVFVLLTPDDPGTSDAQQESSKRRARQNVIFELGFFYAKLQRTSGRVILLYKGRLELPSDISGIIYIDISNGIEAAGEEIRKELKDWFSDE